MFLVPFIRPEGPAPKGQESLAQGLPWVSQNKRFALKGLEKRTPSGSKVWSRFSPYLVAPSGLIRVGRFSQGKPWAMLSWPLRATDWKRLATGSCDCMTVVKNGSKKILNKLVISPTKNSLIGGVGLKSSLTARHPPVSTTFAPLCDTPAWL
jgi:hypothetical protein